MTEHEQGLTTAELVHPDRSDADEDLSTEDLRVAMTRYRSLFERLPSP